jgi:subtilisin family serine protease
LGSILILGSFNLSGFMDVAQSQSATLPAQAQIAQQRANSVDCGDFYVTARAEQKLYRLAGAIALRFEDGRDAAGLLDSLTTSDGLLAEYTSELRQYGSIVVCRAAQTEQSYKLMAAIPSAEVLEAARRVPGVRLASFVFVDPASGLLMIPTGDVIVQLEQGVQAEMVFGNREVRRPPATTGRLMLPLKGATSYDVFAEVTQLAATPGVEWAEPDFLTQGLLCAPDDQYYSQQWHLENTGQGGGRAGADVNAPGAWIITTGSPDVAIAVLDLGVETNHPDLRDNLFTNTGDNNANGIDDDHNGYIDDAHGWDFYTNWNWPNWPAPPLPSYTNGNNDPNPKTNFDNHGTSVAGVAAARGNNVIGVAAAAYTSQLLPIRIGQAEDSSGTFYSYNSAQAAAIRYAAGIDNAGNYLWRSADILNMSVASPATSIDINEALTGAATKGRNGRGCVIFCAAGNDPSGWRSFTLQNIPAGTHTFRWEYRTTSSRSPAGGTVWLDNVIFPAAAVEGFDGPGLPPGWTTGGSANWAGVQNEVSGNHAMTGWGGQESRAVRAGLVQSPQDSSYLEVTKTVPAGEMQFWYWPAMGAGEELLLIGDGSIQTTISATQAQPQSELTSIAYPASHPETIAVGASTNFDYRADYSRYGPGLDFVAPSSGGSLGIYTTDRTGAAGYDAGDYTSSFGGTSAATPLAAGVAALILSSNPNLTARQVRDIMRNTSDKLDSVSYDANGWSPYYGYGRINAEQAVSEATSMGALTVTISPQGAIDAGAQWRRSGTTTWRNSDATESGILIGQYTVEFNDIAGWTKPPDQTVTLSANQATEAGGTYSAATQPPVTVDYPNGGESLQQGTTYVIRWTSSSNVGARVKIHLYRGGSFYSVITSSTSNTGAFFWDIEPTHPPGSDYRIKITSTSNPSHFDYSDNDFSIVVP